MLQHSELLAAESELTTDPSLKVNVSFVRGLWPLLASSSLSGLIFALVDIARAESLVQGSVSVQTGAALVGLWLWFALLLGIATYTVRALATNVKRSLRSARAAGALFSLCVALTALPLGWKLAGGGLHYVANPLRYASWAITFIAALVLWSGLRLRAGWDVASSPSLLRFGIASASMVLALASAVLDTRLAGGYLYFHVLLLAFAVAMATQAIELLGIPNLVRQAALALPLLCAPSLLSFPVSHAARELISQPTWAGAQLVSYVQFHVDFDHDGHSPAFGGDDCNDSDPSIFVGAPEHSGDGRDSDCDGEDDARSSSLVVAPFHGLQKIAAREAAERARGIPTVVILVDALRFDRVGQARFPNLARLTHESLHFTHVYATSSTTLGSVPAMMTGQRQASPARLSIVRAIGTAGQSSRFIAPASLDAHFRRLGSSNPILGFSTCELVAPDHFDGWGEGAPTSDAITNLALKDLQSARPADLLWLHYYDLHEWHWLGDSSARDDSTRYDSVLERLDRSLEPLLEQRDRVTVVLLADHGEGLGAHGVDHHGSFVFEELAHIPMLIRVPGVAPQTIDVPIASTSVFNTLRALRGLDADPSADPSLLSFVGALDVGDGPGFAAFEAAQWSLLYGNHRFLYTPRQQLAELYDVQRDPLERNNLIDAEPGLASQLLTHLFQLHRELTH